MRDHNLNILQLNLQHKKVANSLLIQELSQRNIHVALLQEPYINKQTKQIPGLSNLYSAYYEDENSTAAIIIRNDIKHSLLGKTLSRRLTAVRIHAFDTSLIVISCYAPGSASVPIPEELEQNWGYFKHLSPSVLIGADTNSHSSFLNYPKSDNRALAWEEFLITKNLTLANNPDSITFENSRGHTSRIDWTIATAPLYAKLFNWHTPDDWISLSDHKVITYSIKSVPLLKRQNVANFKKTNWKNFFECLETQLNNVDGSPCLTSPQDIDSYTESLTEALNITIEKMVPKRRHVRHKNAWWTTSLERQKMQVRSLKRKNRAEYLRKKFEFEIDIQKAKNSSWQKFLENAKNQDDAYIRYKVLCKSKTERNVLPVNDENGNLTTTPEESARVLLDKHFPDFAGNPQNDNEILETVQNYLNTDHISYEPLIEDFEILAAVQKTAPRKAPGNDGIPGIVYHKTFSLLLPKLNKLYNAMLELSYFPNRWKNAEIIFLKKPGKVSTYEAKNFRPISLLPVMSKIFERILQNRLNWFSDACQWMNKKQYGFQKKVSAEHASLNLSNFIMTGFKKRKETVAVFLDVSSAFNQIWHNGLLYKLIKKGTPITYIRIIQSYLTDRSATVVIDDDSKVTKGLSQSCPQGAVLSPFLFSIFLDDLLSTCKNHNSSINIQAFADDIVLYMHKQKNETVDEMNDLLGIVSNWAQKWHLSFNKQKTKAVLFSRLRQPNRQLLNLRFGEHSIDVTDHYKYLGIIFDSKLNWTLHRNYAIAKAKKFILQLNAASKCKWGLSPDITRFLYLNAIQPILLYGALVWGNCLLTKSAMKSFQKVERAALLMITCALRTSPTNALYLLAGIIPIKYVLRSKLASEVHRLHTHKNTAIKLDIVRTLEIHKKNFIHFSSLEIATDEFEKSKYELAEVQKSYLLSEIPHPASREPVKIFLSNSSDQIDHYKENALFTDASKSDGHIGYAVVQKKQNDWSVLCDGQIHQDHSVFDGELMAINSALKFLFKNLLTGNFGIFSDSLSGLQALMQTDNCDPLIQDTIDLWRRLKYRFCNVTLFWVPGHVGIDGNERADKAAKAAASASNNVPNKPLYVNKTMLKTRMREQTFHSWQMYWDLSIETGRFTYSLFPKTKIKPPYALVPRNQDKILLNRAATGHFPVNHYLHRFKLRDNDKCSFCNLSETIDHVLTKCPAYARLRHENLALLDVSHHFLSTKDYLTQPKFFPLTLKILKQRMKYSQ